MGTPLSCLRCEAPMELGYVLDQSDAGRSEQRWVQGPPEPSLWMGLQIGGRHTHAVRTYRCTRCGWLESYAVGE
ncbi:MAG: hypothetical protein NW201_00710 [Gemmatimonadales bacterium]|nr:hypothetical protein [Gemmatimonadales bacterium]